VDGNIIEKRMSQTTMNDTQLVVRPQRFLPEIDMQIKTRPPQKPTAGRQRRTKKQGRHKHIEGEREEETNHKKMKGGVTI